MIGWKINLTRILHSWLGQLQVFIYCKIVILSLYLTVFIGVLDHLET